MVFLLRRKQRSFSLPLASAKDGCTTEGGLLYGLIKRMLFDWFEVAVLEHSLKRIYFFHH